MKELKIFVRLLPKKYKYLEDDQGRIDYLGQILYQLGFAQPGQLKKLKTPADHQKVLPPFTRRVRNKVIDGKIIHDFLDVEPLRAKEAIPILNRVLEPHNIKLILITN